MSAINCRSAVTETALEFLNRMGGGVSNIEPSPPFAEVHQSFGRSFLPEKIIRGIGAVVASIGMYNSFPTALTTIVSY